MKRRRQPATQLFLVDEPASARRIREGYELEEAIKRAYEDAIRKKEQS